MTTPDQPEGLDLKCGVCGLPIHPHEAGLRHFGFYKAHSETRCVSLLRDALRTYAQRVKELEEGLRFYADIRNYERTIGKYKDAMSSEVQVDLGCKARSLSKDNTNDR